MDDVVPDITPHLNADDLTLPAFTADDASTYVLADELALVQKFTRLYLHPLGRSTVASAQFVTGVQADQVMEIVTELVPHALVCVVELHGRFHENRKSQPEAIGRGIFSVLYLVFDARTGNFLMFHAPLSSLWLPPRATGGEELPPGWVPSFTEQDVRDYYQRPEYYSSPLPPEEDVYATRPAVVSIHYTTMGELDRVCGEKDYFTINYGAALPVYCVELSGNFLNHGVSTSTVHHTNFNIIDARTGDIICWTSIPARAKWS